MASASCYLIGSSHSIGIVSVSQDNGSQRSTCVLALQVHASSGQQQAEATAKLIGLATSTAALAEPYMLAAGWGNVSAA